MRTCEWPSRALEITVQKTFQLKAYAKLSAHSTAIQLPELAKGERCSSSVVTLADKRGHAGKSEEHSQSADGKNRVCHEQE